jgi:hypothetical protein
MLKKIKDLYFLKTQQLDLFLSKIFYENLVGFKLNREGIKRWQSNKKIFGAKKIEYFPLGYHLFNISNNKLLMGLVKKYNNIIQDPEYAFIYNNNGMPSNLSEGNFFMLKNVMDSIPEVLTIITQDVIDTLYQYYGCHFLIKHIAAYRTTHLPNTDVATSKEVYAYKLHYDRHPVDTLKIFIALSDISLEDGPLTFFDKKFSKILLKKGYKGRDNYGNASDLINANANKIYLLGKRGSAAMCNTAHCLHRAGVPLPGRTRDLLVFSFESSPVHFNSTAKESQEFIRNQINHEYRLNA